ncbi:MAG: RIO1 family regulatory kinase/ATPase [archaeon]
MIENLSLLEEKINVPLRTELKKLGVTKIISFVAEGWRGQVFKIKLGKKTAALKIGSEERILREGSVLKKANEKKVGPKIYGVTKHCVAMQFIYGKPYPKFIESATKKQARTAIFEILKQAEKLDKSGIDHGELSRADKHIVVKTTIKNPNRTQTTRTTRHTSHPLPHTRVYFIDFEKGSFVRKAHNFGSVLNYLLLNPNSFAAKATREKLNIRLAEVKHYARYSSWRKERSWSRSWARSIKANR